MKNAMRLGGFLAAAGAIIAPAYAEGSSEPAGVISKWDGGPVFSGDGWEFRVIGRAQFDYNFADADNAMVDWSGTELRRLRFGVQGKFGENVKYKFELNTDSTGEVVVEDAFMQWAPASNEWSIKVGQYKTPNSLDNETSSRFISTLERAAFVSAFELNRRLGAGVEYGGKTLRFSAGVFSENLEVLGSDQGYALAARAVAAPKLGENVQLHVGASVRYRDAGDAAADFRYRQRPYAHIPGRIISTGSIADKDTFVGAEAAVIAGPFWAAGEYARTFVNCSAAAELALACVDDPSIGGGYAEAGIFLGGAKGYKEGKFERPHVDNPVTKGGMGALALTARFDSIDLDASGVDGGSYNSYIIGADWWATRYTRLGVNLFKVDADLGSSTSGLDPAFAALIGVVPDEDVTGVMVRAQFDF